MRTHARSIAHGAAALMFLACTAAGCVELKYSAANRLADPVSVSISAPPSSVHVCIASSRVSDDPRARSISAALAAALRKKGLIIADSPEAADLVMNGRARFYRKADGTFLFILIFPIYRFNEDYDGISVDLAYKTDNGNWRKNYRVYYRGWLTDDFDRAVDLFCKAVIADLPFPRTEVEKSQ